MLVGVLSFIPSGRLWRESGNTLPQKRIQALVLLVVFMIVQSIGYRLSMVVGSSVGLPAGVNPVKSLCVGMFSSYNFCRTVSSKERVGL